MAAKKKQSEDRPIADPEDLALGVLISELAAEIRTRNTLEKENRSLQRQREEREHQRLVKEGERLEKFLAATTKQNIMITLLIVAVVLGLLQMLGVDLEAISKVINAIWGG